MSPILTRPMDSENERRVMDEIGRAWECECRRMGYLDAWDFHGIRDGRTVFIAELKSRTNPRDKYPTVFLSLHKWWALTNAGMGMGVTPVFVVRWSDAIGYITLREVDPRHNRMAGRPQRAGAPNDTELIIDVPVSAMHALDAGPMAPGHHIEWEAA